MNDRPVVLGIESSCDDTSIAVVTAAGEVRSCVTVSQVEVHEPYGGVYPELASRAHVASIIPAVRAAMGEAGVSPSDLRAIGVTRGPGLIGPLLVGLNTAAGLGLAWDVPVVGVNHLRGHLRSADLGERRVQYPAIVLLVSGGHTLLVRMEAAGSLELLGSTRDDSVGEAYDKVARLLSLGYPGGPAIDRLARQGAPTIAFPRPMLREGLDFSFSGLKTAVARQLERGPPARPEDVAASFVAACLDVLATKCRRALAAGGVRSLVIVGGVAASPQLREVAQVIATEKDVELCLPPQKWATDNGAMIALACWDYLGQGAAPKPRAAPRLSVLEC
jgi:N6-L-threonylcarbamoyladenine synthase